MNSNILESRLYHFITLFSQLTILGMLSVFTSIPLLTAGASMSALYHTITRELSNGSTHLCRRYFQAFGSNLKQTLLPSALFLLYGIVMAMELSNAILGKGDYLLPPFVWICICLFLYTLSLFLFAVISRLQAPFLSLLRLSFQLIFHKPGNTALIFLFLLLSLFVMWLFPAIMILLPGCGMYLIRSFIQIPLEKYIDSLES